MAGAQPARESRDISWWDKAAWPGRERAGAQPPDWQAWFDGAWSAIGAAMPAAQAQAGEPGLPPAGQLGLLEVARPLIAHAQRRLRAALARMLLPPDLAGLPELLAGQPPFAWLTLAVLPAMTLELAVARERGLLAGQSPADRFSAYLRGLADPGAALAVWRRYPALARQVSEILRDWADARTAFARHLAADLPALGVFGPSGAGLGPLAEVRFGSGETHRHGRSVGLVSFAAGTVVYKPRSLAIDVRVDRLLGWFNDHVPGLPLRRLRLLDRGDHGWSEHVAAAPCPDEEAPAYFWRLGALLALAYVMHGFDLHADNVIAVGADPVVVDLEAMFHTGQSQPGLRASRLGDPAAARLAESVLANGLLPGPLVMPDVETGRPFGVDISPMGITPVRRSLIRVPTAVDEGADQMRLVQRYIDVPAPAGRLALSGGGPVSPARHRDDVVAGFTAAYQRLQQAGEGLLGPGGPLAGCDEVGVRLVQLSTFLYVRLLMDSWHPDFLRDAAERDRALARLRAGWPGVPHRSELRAAELEALRRGEVPVFEIRPGHRDVWLEDGARLPGVLGERPIDAVRRRLGSLSRDGLAEQVAVIDAALAAAQAPAAGGADPALARTKAGRGRPSRAAPGGEFADGESLLAAARRVADHLDATAVRAGGRVGWITAEVVDARHTRLAPAGLDLYAGLPGIGMFLSYLGLATSDERITDLAVEVADEVVARLRADAALAPRTSRRSRPAGAFGPICGPVYHLAHASAVHGRADYAHAARSFLLPQVAMALGAPGRDRPPAAERQASRTGAGAPAGLAEGHAGCLAALLALQAAAPGDDVLALAASAGRAEAAAAAAGPGPVAGEAGIAYGMPGSALALARWHHLSGDPPALSAARALVLAATAPPAPAPPPGRAARAGAAGWCAGRTGAGLAWREIAGLPAFADLSGALDEEMRLCAATVAGALAGADDDSLCHGSLGMALLLADAPAGCPGLPAAGLDPRQWRAALRGPVPGLFPGLAGVGFGLLRLACPQVTPQILLLPPPAARGPAAQG